MAVVHSSVGILFRDITTLCVDPEAFHATIDAYAARYAESNIDYVAGVDSRGFIFGAAVAYKLRKPFLMIRKIGKTPGAHSTLSISLTHV